ncbi:MAG TPA: type II CAAX endopeptidase family protein [Bryobacteraceae bacterium]|nr:type II CAAX endopeptidase family protein [Bryobacteraceae bacterium]
MRILIPVLFLSMILSLLCGRLQEGLQRTLSARPALVFLAPAVLSLLFCGIASAMGALSIPLVTLILIYTFAPTVCCYSAQRLPPPAWPDFLVILLLWMPLEFGAGARWVPKPAQGLLHMAAYGVSVTLGLVLFLLFRRLGKIKYNLPRSGEDLVNVLIGFACVAPVLIVLGRALGFLAPFHVPVRLSAARLVAQLLIILAATALPEEILFRGFIQNGLMQKLGSKFTTLLLAALVFGCAHLDNGPEPLPNWRYMILATIAGVAYGKVYEKSSSIFASATLHAIVNTIRHSFF